MSEDATPTDVTPESVDDFDRAVQEWDNEVAKFQVGEQPAEPQEPEEPSEEGRLEPFDLAPPDDGSEWQLSIEREAVAAVEQQLEEERLRLHRERELLDFERVLGFVEEELGVRQPGALIPTLLGLYASDAGFKRAWDERGKNPYRWEHTLSRAVENIGAMFESRYDAEATVDRWAVSDAVKGATRAPAPSAPPAFGKMSDHELNEWGRSIGLANVV